MKIKCDNCEQELNIVEISSRFENFQVGQIKCKNGHLQKRYISESDLLIYFGFAAIIYDLTYLIIISLFLFVGIQVYTIIATVVLFVLIFYILKFITKYIYTKAPFKSDYKNNVLVEDQEAVSKRTKWQFIMFMLVSFMLGINGEFYGYLFLLLGLFILIIFIKVHFQIKNERASIKDKNIKLH